MHNAALRNATGYTQDPNIQHLHDETFILPIREHLQPHPSQYKPMHLATRGNNKIRRTPPTHISSSEEILPLAQLRTNTSPFLKSYLHKVDAKTS